MQNIRVIGICGYKQVGKDTLAAYLRHQYGYTVRKIAAPIKQMCALLFNLSEEQLTSRNKECVDYRWNVTPRQIMQYVGTDLFQHKLAEMMPHIGKTFWIQHLLQGYDEDRMVVADVRFLHEAAALKKLPGCVLLRLERPCLAHNDPHISEQEVGRIQVDAVIQNEGTKAQLLQQTDTVLTRLSQQMPPLTPRVGTMHLFQKNRYKDKDQGKEPDFSP